MRKIEPTQGAAPTVAAARAQSRAEADGIEQGKADKYLSVGRIAKGFGETDHQGVLTSSLKVCASDFMLMNLRINGHFNMLFGPLSCIPQLRKSIPFFPLTEELKKQHTPRKVDGEKAGTLIRMF